MTKKDEDFENFTKFWFCDNIYVDGDVIVREKNWGKFRGYADRYFNIKSILNHEIFILSNNQNILTHIIFKFFIRYFC